MMSCKNAPKATATTTAAALKWKILSDNIKTKERKNLNKTHNKREKSKMRANQTRMKQAMKSECG